MAKESIVVDFNRPVLVGDEMEYIAQAVESGHISGDGQFSRRCQAILEEVTGSAKVLLTTSCTHALEMAALLLDFRPGDEVIFPSFTFVSTVNAFVLRGVKPVFADIRQDTLNLDESQLPDLITNRTRAIVPVHYAGVACEMDRIMDLAARHGLAIVEDNAHGLFGKYRGRPLGTFGQFGTLSFHETKNVTCGEGGALLVNRAADVERAEIVREKGTDRSRFFRGQVDKYSWVSLGSSYVLSDLLAAMLLAQLENWQRIQARRRAIWETYLQGLTSWAALKGVRLPIVPTECEQSYHMFYLLLPDLRARTALIQYLRDRGIYSVFHYLPLHLSTMGKALGGKEGDCPVTEQVSDRLVRLPFYNGLTDEQLRLVIDTIMQFQA
jgi:dTDP-4-amino-4,6-dideoxygalactose transaminase